MSVGFSNIDQHLQQYSLLGPQFVMVLNLVIATSAWHTRLPTSEAGENKGNQMVGKSKGSAQQKMAATVWFDGRNSGSTGYIRSGSGFLDLDI